MLDGSVACRKFVFCCFFFFNDTATTEIYTLSLHDAHRSAGPGRAPGRCAWLRHTARAIPPLSRRARDRKSTRLNSSHLVISYAVFCLKKKKIKINKYFCVNKKKINK